MQSSDLDAWHMTRALELAERGRGAVEPNPLVGCVIARGAEIIGEGWHQRFGGPHAEIEALRIAGSRAKGATLYVTLEPCCHHGKTPPCTDAVIASGVARVVVAGRDPFPQVDGGGIERLQQAGIDVTVGVREAEARRLNAPYLKLLSTGRPWIIAKWAMTLDGKLATRDGDSRWISCEASRQIVHRLRGRVDAIVVGLRTAELDDPLLTARPPGPRVATRIVLDSQARLASDSQLVRTASETPVMVATGPSAPPDQCRRLHEGGCEVFSATSDDPQQRLIELLDDLGRRRMTNVLVEGGGQLLGTLFDADLVDEVHVFIAPKIIGGRDATTPVAGIGKSLMADALPLADATVERSGDDVYVHGLVHPL